MITARAGPDRRLQGVVLWAIAEGKCEEPRECALRYTQAANLPTIVRPPSKEYHDIARALDIGAEGIMLPKVESAKEARHILDCIKFTPEGHRGVIVQVLHDRFIPGPIEEKFEAANRFTTFFAQIETGAGVANADAIAALDGVDCLFVGHYDLSASLGIPGAVRPSRPHAGRDHRGQSVPQARQVARLDGDKRGRGRRDASKGGRLLHLLGRCLGASRRGQRRRQ